MAKATVPEDKGQPSTGKSTAPMPEASISTVDTTAAMLEAITSIADTITPMENTAASNSNAIPSTDNTKAPTINIVAPVCEEVTSRAENPRGRPRSRSRSTRGAARSRGVSKSRSRSATKDLRTRLSGLTLQEPKVFKGRGLTTWPQCSICGKGVTYDETDVMVFFCDLHLDEASNE